ncbi:MAG TPA: aldehyde dehydrogenase family protein, partial [Candidatus Hydrogenedentes bacterium]|nr:aldehyde dehydrogenase family protein [Candidatus Hydrogenedentota bacterium]
TFTGSPEVGWGIRADAPRKRVSLELGNNAPVIVEADSDWASAAAKIAAGVLVLAACIGSAFMFEVPDLSATNVAPDFFSTSVMIACGRGFITPVVSTIPALSDFLLQKTNTFDPKQLPDTFPTFRNSRFTDNHFYLLTAAGWIWKVFGMDWRVLKLLFVVLYCASAGVVYGLFRLGMNRLFSALGALFFMTAPLVLTTLPNLRDFAKAPFLLGVILMLGHLVARPLTPRRLFGLAAGIGLTIGFGQGFRQDLFICLIPSVLIIAFFARGMGPLSVGRRLAALALFILSYAFAVWPCRATSTDEGTLMFHNVIMGLSSECSDLLGVGKASYDMEYLCNDNFAHAARCSYARRIKGKDIDRK